jgi:hypothetical protein
MFVGIHYRRALEFVDSSTLPPKIHEFWYSIAGFQWPEFGNYCQNPTMPSDSGRPDPSQTNRKHTNIVKFRAN